MDVTLKGLNLRRVVGSDQVRVVSLGSAVSDSTMTDAYGRKWQLRVWPVPYLDVYLVAQLLPTPDGYVGLIQYAPSAGLQDVKIEMSLLASQVTLAYHGTFAQWRSFLARTALLPETLKDVKLESGAGWTLHTRRFESSVPPTLMQLDAHSLLLVDMNYTLEGARAVWDIGGVCWYRDPQEKAYLGLRRKPRPPATARREMRTRFDDLQARHSPYDGTPVRTSADTVEMTMAVSAPGTKAGMDSADVVYELSLRLEGYPSVAQASLAQTTAQQATRILEHGVGPDVAAAAPASLSAELTAQLNELRQRSSECDQLGRDFRGRLCSEDAQQYLLSMVETAMHTQPGPTGEGDLEKTFNDRAQAFKEYWYVAPQLVHNRDLWHPFLLHNHLPEGTPHEAAVLSAESNLTALFNKGGPPTADWVLQSQALSRAYIDERARMARSLGSHVTGVVSYRPRKSACPAPAEHTSGNAKPRPGPVAGSLAEFYPVTFRRLAIEGLVVLSITVNSSGCGVEAAVVGSSGADELDEAALSWFETASFLPAEKDGKAVDGSFEMAVNFKLH
jgi:TonB family protein